VITTSRLLAAAAAFLVGFFSRGALAATIQTDGSYVTGVIGLQVPNEGAFNVDFVFDSFGDLFGSPSAPSPTPTFFNNLPGGVAAAAALVNEFNSAGGLLGVKDDVSSITTVDANISVGSQSNLIFVEEAVSLSGNWILSSNLAITPNIDFMHAIFTRVPEPSTGSLALVLSATGIAMRRRR
jgi:hypothetical protein